MIYEFKSRATGTVVTTQAVAERILQIIGKSTTSKGVILPEQMPAAIDALKRAIDTDAQSSRKPSSVDVAHDELDNEPADAGVSLAQRAFPFLEMLREAYAARKEITWGV
jgi:hypothetical protein